MGIYLNPGADAFKIGLNSKIYVDKTGMIFKLNRILHSEQRFVCISRPRRFGKSMTANMICAYYDRTVDGSVFDGLEISSCAGDSGEGKSAKRNASDPADGGNARRNAVDSADGENARGSNGDSADGKNTKRRVDDPADGMAMQGKFNVLRINMQEFLSRTHSVDELVDRLQKRLCREMVREYPEVDFFDRESLPDVMEEVYADTGTPFVVVIDEWDCIFREYPQDKEAQKRYLDFLRDWLKDKTYIALAYMTGILPIKKYGTHSALNMFSEYSMENPGVFAQYVGFTEDEVRSLCTEYGISFDDCSNWYDGYYFHQCGHVYNPKSIVSVMLSGIFDDYWNKTETYEALQVYIDMNYDGLRDAIVEMMAGARVKINTGSFQNDMTTFAGRDDVLTLLIHLGYLGYDFDTKEVFIPNREVLMEFVTATTVGKWDEIVRSVSDSDHLLEATWSGDAEAVAAGIEKAHLETSHLQYNDENALSYTVSLAYYAARQYYRVVRELPAGKGFADVTFIPRAKYAGARPAMIVELKWDASADTAIRQIHEKAYDGVLRDYTGQAGVLLVGISYDRKSRKHSCIIEKLEK